MSHQSSSSRPSLDPFRFAAEARTQSGTVKVADLPRLADALATVVGELSWRLEGSMSGGQFRQHGGSRAEPRLRLQVDGQLGLACQRCLGELSWTLAIDTTLQPVREGQPIAEDELENDEFDAIEVGDSLDLFSLVEDEVLLALPLVARHEHCELPREFNGAREESPFAALAPLRGSRRAD
ncbi:MAG: YceD family protein [Thauera sp.]|jgi:uncharacterized protein|nr:YceD family protein [Thauera sp.]